MSSMILDVDRVSYGYPGSQGVALQTVSFGLSVGSITALVGANGAGKTTLMKLLMGAVQPQQGQIKLAGSRLESLSLRQRSHLMAWVPQQETAPYNHTVLDYVVLGRTPYLAAWQVPSSGDFAQAERALGLVGAQGWQDRGIQTLSGGEWQLVLLARALAQDPQLLVLDEPTAHLDLAHKKRLIDCLHQLHQQGLTILFSCHEPDVVMALATDAVLLRQGSVVTAGSLAQVWTADTLSLTYGMPIRLESLEQGSVVLWR